MGRSEGRSYEGGRKIKIQQSEKWRPKFTTPRKPTLGQLVSNPNCSSVFLSNIYYYLTQWVVAGGHFGHMSMYHRVPKRSWRGALGVA